MQNDLHLFSSPHMICIPQPNRRHRALVFGSQRTVARNRPLYTMARSTSFAVVTDQKLQKVDIWVRWGHTFLCLSPDLAQSSQNKDRSVPINQISLWLILYFWKNCRQACSQL